VKFSIRQMLYGMVVAAFIAAMLGAGANGSPLAYGLGVSICMLVVYFLMFAIIYWTVLFLFAGDSQPRVVSVKDELEDTAP